MGGIGRNLIPRLPRESAAYTGWVEWRRGGLNPLNLRSRGGPEACPMMGNGPVQASALADRYLPLMPSTMYMHAVEGSSQCPETSLLVQLGTTSVPGLLSWRNRVSGVWWPRGAYAAARGVDWGEWACPEGPLEFGTDTTVDERYACTRAQCIDPQPATQAAGGLTGPTSDMQ